MQRARTGAAERLLAVAWLVLAAHRADAVDWHWSNPLPNGNNIVSIAYNGNSGQSLEVGELGQVYYGDDFFDWLPANSGTTNDLQSVIYFGNRAILTGANGTVGYSDDGINFTATSLNPTNWLVAVAASSNRLVTVGDNAAIFTSSDGVTWASQAKPPGVGGNWLLNVAWGEGTFVIAGEDGYLANSGDGIHWTNHSPSGYSGDDMTYVGWVSTTNPMSAFPYTGFWAATDTGKALYSTNHGIAWHAFSGIVSTNTFYAAVANDSTALLAGDSDVQLGTNASHWTQQTGALLTQAPVWTYYSALWDTNGDYQLCGDDGMLVQGAADTNGNYIWQQQFPVSHDWLWQATVVDSLYVAVGDHAGIMTSDNGADWTIEAVPETNSVTASNTVFFCVGGTTNLLVAAGNQGSLAVSPRMLVTTVITNTDGTLLTNLANSIGVVWYSLPAPTTNDMVGVCAFSNAFFLVGGNATLLASADGTNWAKMSVPTTNYLSGLAPGSNILVAVGDQGTILTSLDGTNWTNRVSGTTNWLFRVRCLNNQFIATGENGTLLTSTNGLDWTSAVSGTTNWLNDAIEVSNICFAVGNGGTVVASTNFVTWTNAGTITSSSLYGGATQNGQLVVVGFGGTILRSPIIPVLTPVNFVAYSQSSGDNVFLVAGVVDQQFTLDSSTDLVNWVTGPLLDLQYGDGTLEFITPANNGPSAAQYFRCTLVP